MARQRTAVQVNQFVGGINTEANLINFPENSSLDESNMEMLKNGSRVRRDGFDLETGYVEVDTNITPQYGKKLARSQFRWESPGGIEEKQFIVVQVGNYIGVHDIDDSTSISNGLIYSYTFDTTTYSTTYGYASNDGRLVIATGLKAITILSYDEVNGITRSEDTLLIRDLFGVESTAGGIDVTDFLKVQTRPSSKSDTHIYNLRNQTWALPRVEGDADTTTLIDPIQEFYLASSSTVYPANADSIIPHLLANANYASNRTIERFNATDLYKTPPGTSRAPVGYFIIDALERGTSRLAQEAALRSNNPTLSHAVTTLLEDKTPGGPSVLASYSGRIWYAGFSGEVINGDDKSPSMSSYILFSRVVQDPSQLTKCYQEADPTSHIDSDIVDDDGGFLKLDGAYGIKRMVNTQSSLFVFATNGVWRIVGADENLFKATEYSVFKITNKGCVSANSVVEFNGSLLYWSEDGIYVVTIDQNTGDWSSQDITQLSIQSLYQEISSINKSSSVGYYDITTNSVRWLYGVDLGFQTDANEIILNTKFNVFTKNLISTSTILEGPVSVSGGQTRIVSQNAEVTANSVTVTSAGLTVTSSVDNLERSSSDTLYCIVIESSPSVIYTFGGYKVGSIYDWDSISSIDSPAYIITGPITVGDGRLRKNIPYITVYLDRTELDVIALDSSCLLSTRWDWTSAATSGKWSNPRQVYRVLRDEIGQEMIVTRNKIRGFGRSVSLKFESEAGKTLKLYGWEHNIEATTDE